MDVLAKRIAKRDKTAFAELYEQTNRLVYSVCLSIVKDRGLAEDLTQDTFVCVWSEIQSFRGVGFKTWLLTVAKNKSLNELRKRKREVATDFLQDEQVLQAHSDSERMENNLVLSVALERLEEVDRQIVLMKNGGVKTKEIALLLGMPRGTVSWRYAEALKTLKKLLEAKE